MLKVVSVVAGNEEYEIRIDRGILHRAGLALRDLLESKSVHVVADKNVADLYLKDLLVSLAPFANKLSRTIIPAGEGEKSIKTLEYLYGNFLTSEITRSDMIVALGGGVVGDLVGFAASTYLRGISFVQIPTTLLAQVDSSVGGKVAINLPEGKNLVGNFYHPKRVLIDPHVLKTLSSRLLSEGMAEVIKYGAIAKKDLFDELAQNSLADTELNLDRYIADCCLIKASIVERDPWDKGERMLLNFGHTVGHAIEEAAGYGMYFHGEAISIGMKVASRYGELKGYTEAGTTSKLEKVLQKYSLPTACNEGLKIAPSMKRDKKRMGNSINFIFLESIGKAFFNKIDWNIFIKEVEEIVDENACNRTE